MNQTPVAATKHSTPTLSTRPIRPPCTPPTPLPAPTWLSEMAKRVSCESCSPTAASWRGRAQQPMPSLPPHHGTVEGGSRCAPSSSALLPEFATSSAPSPPAHLQLLAGSERHTGRLGCLVAGQLCVPSKAQLGATAGRGAGAACHAGADCCAASALRNQLFGGMACTWAAGWPGCPAPTSGGARGRRAPPAGPAARPPRRPPRRARPTEPPRAGLRGRARGGARPRFEPQKGDSV